MHRLLVEKTSSLFRRRFLQETKSSLTIKKQELTCFVWSVEYSLSRTWIILNSALEKNGTSIHSMESDNRVPFVVTVCRRRTDEALEASGVESVLRSGVLLNEKINFFNEDIKKAWTVVAVCRYDRETCLLHVRWKHYQCCWYRFLKKRPFVGHRRGAYSIASIRSGWEWRGRSLCICWEDQKGRWIDN